MTSRAPGGVARVLLTGGTGFVGGRVAGHLRARGDEVLAIVRAPSEELERHGVEQVIGELDAPDLPTAVHDARIDAVIHAAASMDDHLEVARQVNRDATRRLADLARERRARFVYVSTTSVYDLRVTGDAVVHEDAPLLAAGADAPAISSSAGAYGASKAEGEIEVRRAGDSGLAATVLRPPAVLGTGPTSTWGTRAPARLRDGTWTPPHPETTMGWIHLDDLVDAILAVLDHPLRDTVNVVGGHTTFGAFVSHLARFVPGISPDVIERADTSRVWRGSYATARLEQRLGIIPQRSFDLATDEIERWWSDPAIRLGGGAG